MRLRAIKFFLVLLTFFSGSAALFAEEELPAISSYSQLNFAVHRGDKIRLQVEATGEGLDAKWIRSNETFCRELSCEVDTSNWGLGTHKIVFVLFNTRGSLFLKYKIKILTVPPGYKPGPVTPELVTELEKIEKVSEDDFAVVTTLGRGFSSHNKKVQVIGPIARAMDWTEKLKTQPGSHMEIFATGREAHSLLSSTAVALLRSDTGRRAILLRKGTIRSRQLAAEKPDWLIMSGNWLQVDGDEKADLFVRRIDEKKDDYEVGVFRGQARITVKYTGSQEKGPIRHELTLVAGEMVKISRREKSAPQKMVGNPTVFSEIFREATSHYIPPNLFSDRFAENHLVLGPKLADAEKNAIAVAQDSLASLDFIVVLEALNKKLAKPDMNVEVLLLGAEAYLGLLQLREAKLLLSDAKAANAEHPGAHFLEAVAFIIEKNWKACLLALDKAESRDFENEQLLDFYRGRCELGMTNTVGARNAFTYATWDNREPILTKTAQDILATLDDERWIMLQGRVGAGFDSNVFRLAEGSELMTDVGARESWFTNGFAAARFWPFRAKDGFAAFGIESGRKDFTNKSLKNFSVMRQKLDLEMQLNIGGAAKPAFFFNGSVAVQTVTLGKVRNMDTLANRLLIGAPVWWNLKFYHLNVVNSDPFPVKNDRVDANRREIVAASDRSCKDRTYGISTTPIAENYQLSIAVEDFISNYRTSETSQENYRDLVLRLGNGYQVTPRNRLNLDLSGRSRKFAESEDGRKDSVLQIDTGWQFLWSTSFHHELGLIYEKSNSSRSDFSFGRQTLQFDVVVEI